MSTTIAQTNATQKFKKSFGGSIKSIFNSGGRTYFILEHKSTTAKHKIGETTEFIGDYVEMGRGNTYAVNFGEDCSSVSRPHAAITRSGDAWVLQHLSKSNSTIVNNLPVADKRVLTNGDEIQLSSTGPKMSFLIPANNKVSTMGMTIRMKALVNEAIKPYKKTIGIISLVFLACIGGLIFWNYQQAKKFELSLKDIETRSKDIQKQMADSITLVNKENKRFQKQLKKMSIDLEKVKHTFIPPYTASINNPNSADATLLKGLYPNVYYIISDKIVVKTSEETKEINYRISGTGYMLANGDFITARHVIEPWMYGKSEDDKLLNIIASNGAEVTHYFTAYSPDGTKIKFTSNDFRTNKSSDKQKSITDDDGNTFLYTITSLRDGSDWGASHTNFKNGLQFDKALSSSLSASTNLYVLGYSLGLGAENLNKITPGYNECKVSIDGLDKGVINISGRGFDQGNSGGPVFIKNQQQQYVVIGIVSAQLEQQGFVVPISSVQ